MEVKYYGHSCFSVHIGGKTILFDPFISPNVLAANINIREIKTDYIFIIHAHFDHVADAIEIAQNNNAQVVGIYELTQWFNQQGYANTHAMNIGGWWNFSFGKVQMVNAVHSSTFADGSNGGNPAGFVVSSTHKTFYYSGDTALTMDMQLIPRRHKLDIAFLPVGNNFTMDITDAITASDFIQCNTIIGMHYDTFGYIKIDHQAAIQAFETAGKKLLLFDIEQTTEL
jgi:L-ascorbate metabolism protein UlaG (beta-lactamase superfamily)